MEHHAIDWETVAVTRGARGFELSVRLGAEPSPDWETIFNQATEQWGLSVQSSGWSHTRIEQGAISMRELEPDAREQARRYLEDIVSRTNAALAAKLEEEERERIRLEEEEAELARTAKELTEWFRAAGPGGPTLSRLPEKQPDADQEHGRPLELPDLRRRLAQH